MTGKQREEIYDKQIAPELLRLGKIAQDNGMTFIAAVEWDAARMDDNGSGTTITLADDFSIAMRMTAYAAKAHANFDSFMIAMIRYAREHGPGNSAFLQMLLSLHEEKTVIGAVLD